MKRQFSISISIPEFSGKLGVILNDEFRYKRPEYRENLMSDIDKIKSAFLGRHIGSVTALELRHMVNDLLNIYLDKGYISFDHESPEYENVGQTAVKEPEPTYYLISYVWSRRGNSYQHYANHVTYKTPAVWLQDFLNEDEEIAILNVVEISKKEYEDLKDRVN